MMGTQNRGFLRGWRSVLPILCCLVAPGALAATGDDWEPRGFGGIQLRMPKAWQVQQQATDAVAYGTVLEGGARVLFAYGWEEDLAKVRRELEADGMVFRDVGRRTLSGISFLERELLGTTDGDPAWLHQLVAEQPRQDSRTLMIQYGLVGTSDPEPYLADFELVLASLGLGPDTPAPAGPGGDAPAPADPQAQARAIFKEIAALDDQDLDGIEARYLRVIDDYPQTEQAQESYWRLSNLYLQAYDPPRNPAAIALLERYLAGYPGSTWLDERFQTFARPGIGLVHHRLLGLYQAGQEWQKAASLYQGLLPSPDQITAETLAFVPGYAETLEALGRDPDALAWYQAYVERAEDPQDPITEMAREAIERLGGGAAAEGTATPAPAAETAATGPAAEPATPVAAPAQTAGPGPDAAALAAAGRALLGKGDYAGALERFRASVALKADPQLQERIKKLEAYLGTR